MNNRLPRRLQIIAGLVSGGVVADVGCDHGKLADYLLREKKVEKMIVSDISMPSLQKAIDLLSKNNYNFEYIHCDGLLGYVGKAVDQCIISGMGGDEMVKIIKNSPIKIQSFVLSPQHNNIDVKRFVLESGYEIDFDIIIKDKGKFYNIFRCVATGKKPNYSRFNMFFGEDNFINPNSDIWDFVEFEMEKTANILEKNPQSETFQEYLDMLKECNKRK